MQRLNNKYYRNNKNIIELLSPDIKIRLKVKDIFTHPWVVNFEKDYKRSGKVDNQNFIDKLDFPIPKSDKIPEKLDKKEIKKSDYSTEIKQLKIIIVII